MGVNETLRAHQSLLEYKLPVSSCLVNRVTPEFDHEFLQKRRNAELLRISELSKSLDGVEVSMMELLDEEVIGVANLRKVAADLYGDIEPLPKTLGLILLGKNNS